MSANPSCAEIRELAPEVVLGIASGEDRARVLRHIAACPACRRAVAELSVIADDLLLLAPPREPPIGFETRVLGRLERPARRRPRAALLAVAAAIVAAAVGAGTVFWATADDRRIAGYVRNNFAIAGGEWFGVTELQTAGGERAGIVFGYQGDTNWLLVVMDEPMEGTYSVRLRPGPGTSMALGRFTFDEPRRTWGRDVRPDVRGAELRMVSTDDGDRFVAKFAARD